MYFVTSQVSCIALETCLEKLGLSELNLALIIALAVTGCVLVSVLFVGTIFCCRKCYEIGKNLKKQPYENCWFRVFHLKDKTLSFFRVCQFFEQKLGIQQFSSIPESQNHKERVLPKAAYVSFLENGSGPKFEGENELPPYSEDADAKAKNEPVYKPDA